MFEAASYLRHITITTPLPRRFFTRRALFRKTPCSPAPVWSPTFSTPVTTIESRQLRIRQQTRREKQETGQASVSRRTVTTLRSRRYALVTLASPRLPNACIRHFIRHAIRRHYTAEHTPHTPDEIQEPMAVIRSEWPCCYVTLSLNDDRGE